MATKRDYKAAHDRIFTRPRPTSESDQEMLRKTEDDGVYPSSLNVKTIRLDRIQPDSDRPPRSYSDEDLAELGNSLLAHGQLAPILVQYLGDEDVFVLVDGERRWRAAQRVGLQSLHAIILGRLAPAQRYEWQLVSAIHAGAWSARQRAQALHVYKEMKKLASWAEAAQGLGLAERTLLAMLEAGDLLALPAPEPESSPAPSPEQTPVPSDIDRVAAATLERENPLGHLPVEEASPADAGGLPATSEKAAAAQRARLPRGKPRSAGDAPAGKGRQNRDDAGTNEDINKDDRSKDDRSKDDRSKDDRSKDDRSKDEKGKRIHHMPTWG